MLDFHLIEKTIKNKNYSLKYFVPKVTDMTVAGFRKSILHKTLKVSTLEEISKALDLEMTYWWSQNPELVREDGKKYEINKENAELRKEINRCKKTIDHLNDLIAELKEKQGITKKKEAASG